MFEFSRHMLCRMMLCRGRHEGTKLAVAPYEVLPSRSKVVIVDRVAAPIEVEVPAKWVRRDSVLVARSRGHAVHLLEPDDDQGEQRLDL